MDYFEPYLQHLSVQTPPIGTFELTRFLTSVVLSLILSAIVVAVANSISNQKMAAAMRAITIIMGAVASVICHIIPAPGNSLLAFLCAYALIRHNHDRIENPNVVAILLATVLGIASATGQYSYLLLGTAMILPCWWMIHKLFSKQKSE